VSARGMASAAAGGARALGAWLAFALAALCLLVIDGVHPIGPAARAFAALTLLLVLVRLAISLHRNRELAERLRAEAARNEEAASRRAAAEQAARAEGVHEMVTGYSAFAERLAGGDLTVRLAVNGDPELAVLAENMNRMVAGLAGLSGAVRGASEDVGSAAARILAAIAEHSAATAEQAAAVASTTATAEQVRALAAGAARRARLVAEEAEAAATVADEGAAVVDELVARMGAISERVEQIAADLGAFTERTRAIDAITRSVGELADQSNLLALNAAIEAARAGEHGRGFAVVADEVRSLAERSKAATHEVHRIVADLERAGRAVVAATEEGTIEVRRGTALAERAGGAIERMTGTIRDTARRAGKLAGAADEQHAGMDRIADAMEDISRTTAMLAEGAEETHAAAESLDALAGRLGELTHRYRVGAAV
jgi:methyl-accepting chemotaxis protein